MARVRIRDKVCAAQFVWVIIWIRVRFGNNYRTIGKIIARVKRV